MVQIKTNEGISKIQYNLRRCVANFTRNKEQATFEILYIH